MIPSDKHNQGSGTPVLMSFKDFMIKQEDDIDEDEAVRRYREYKVEFKRTQINDFFVLHKNKEWFEEKYHPEKSVERKRFVRQSMRKRLRVFLDLWEAGYIDDLSLQISNTSTILKLLDRVIIKLEGGTEDDLKALDEPPKALENKKPENMETDEEKKEEMKPKAEEKPKNYTYDADTAEDDEDETKEPLPPGMDEDDESLKPPGMDEEEEEKEKEEPKAEEDVKKEEEEEVQPTFIYEGHWDKRPTSIFIRSVANTITRNDMINVCKHYPGFMRVAMSDASAERRYSRRCWVTFSSDTNIKDVCWNLSNVRVKEMELSPSVNRDVTNRVRPVNGLACSPMAMQMDINYAVELMKKLDDRAKIYEVEETNGHVENEDEEMQKEDEDNDEDKKEGEEEEGEEKKEVKNEDEKIEIPEKNPVLEKLPSNYDQIINDSDLKKENDDENNYPIVINEELQKNLDLVLLYLRIVHCLDYYNANEYQHEDEMPMRCGIMHVRAQPLESACKKDINEYFVSNTNKLDSVVVEEQTATEEEAEKLGKKAEENEVENFIKANTQELAKDKWLCPLSGKKFRGPEFVRKHIMMKHDDSVENVKKEVKYFNNYVFDMNRPCFPEGRPKTSESSGMSRSSTGNWNSRQQSMATPKSSYSGGGNYSTPQMQNVQQSETYGRVNTYPPKQIRRGGYRDRKVIKYRDLDAPEESDFF